jgi:DNA-directed RNA polymerase specialized sigma24 family protein
MLDLDEALQRLAAHDERKSALVELLFFGGLTYDEAAAALKISPATVHRELTMAKPGYIGNFHTGFRKIITHGILS